MLYIYLGSGSFLNILLGVPPHHIYFAIMSFPSYLFMIFSQCYVVKVFVEIHLLATFWAQNVQMNVFLQVRQCIGVFLQLLVKTDKTGYKAFNMHIQQTYLNLFYILFDLLLN